MVRIVFSFYQLLFENNIPLLLEYHIITALRESADLPIKEAAEILNNALDKIIEGDIEPQDEEDENEDDEAEDEETLAQAHANVVAAHQKLAEAMSGEKIAEIQRQMDEALKAGNVAEYMRLATELQMLMLSSLGS